MYTVQKSYSLSDLGRVCDMLTAAGFDGIEYNINAESVGLYSAHKDKPMEFDSLKSLNMVINNMFEIFYCNGGEEIFENYIDYLWKICSRCKFGSNVLYLSFDCIVSRYLDALEWADIHYITVEEYSDGVEVSLYNYNSNPALHCAVKTCSFSIDEFFYFMEDIAIFYLNDDIETLYEYECDTFN